MFWKKGRDNGRKKNGKIAPEADPTSIGNILIQHGFVDARQLEEACQYQTQHPDILMGESLVRLGYLARNELDAACEQQDLFRNGNRRLAVQAMAKTAEAATARTDAFTERMVGVHAQMEALLTE